MAEIIFGNSGWMATYITSNDGSVVADVIVDNNGIHRDYNKFFPSLSALKEYLDSK